MIEGKILRWGNSYGLRIRKEDVERAGLQPGQEIVARIKHGGDKIDVSDAPFFRSGYTDTSVRHDEVLADWVYERKILANRPDTEEDEEKEETEGDA